MASFLIPSQAFSDYETLHAAPLEAGSPPNN
ncbi:MAG: hypothetical protein ACI8V5_004385, partial [Limisphaerales bacterium]